MRTRESTHSIFDGLWAAVKSLSSKKSFPARQCKYPIKRRPPRWRWQQSTQLCSLSEIFCDLCDALSLVFSGNRAIAKIAITTAHKSRLPTRHHDNYLLPKPSTKGTQTRAMQTSENREADELEALWTSRKCNRQCNFPPS